ncbi:MAG: PaaI family thioesterase [Anaerovoracaceae bacterium]
MSINNKTTGEWLKAELEFINTKMRHTLNGKMAPQLESYSDEEKEITLKYPVMDWEVNGLGTLHGGISSTMMDLTMSMAVYCFSREMIPPTISMTINYLRPIPIKDGVLIKAKVTSIGKKNATAYCEAIIPESGKTACTAIGTYAVIKKEK